MYQPFYQPYNLNSFQSGYQQQSASLIRVTGIEGAKAYQMPANSTSALFDANEDIMYIKTTDGAGFPTIRTFKFEEMLPTQMSGTSAEYISRKEFEDFKAEVLDYGKQLVQRSGAAAKSKSAANSNGNDKG